MVPFLLAAVASDGSVTFDSNAPASSDFWIGPQRYGAAKVFGTEDAVAGTDTRANGLRYTSEGVLRVYDATSAVPAGATTLGGFAVTSDGQLCVSTDAVSSATFVGGIAVRSDGAVFATGLSTPRSIADAIITALTPAAWYRNATDVVSSGGFASVWGDQSTSTVALNCPGIASPGNYASTPDSAAISLTGDLEIVGRVSLVDWVNGAVQGIFGSLNAGATAGLQLRVAATGVLNFGWGDGVGFNTTPSTVAPTVTDGDTLWVKVTVDIDRGDSKYEVKFYTAADQSAEPSSWTQLGTTVVGASAMTIANGDGAGTIGFLAVTGAYTSGKFYRVILRNGIAGTTVFDADFSSQTLGAASFTESSSNAATVTINTSGAAPAHIGKARDLLQGTGTNQPAYSAGVFTFDGADNFMKATFALNQPSTVVLVGSQVSWTSNDSLFDGATGNLMRLYQNTATPNLAAYAGSVGPQGTNLAVGSRGIVVVCVNGASSSLRVNNNAKSTNNAGASNSDGFTLGAFGAGIATWANMTAEEAILFPSALSDANQDAVITALNNALTVF